ncbi:NitT/TauT family transport system permease protein [Phyllobacterium trifolii]|uniref:NitT/TauT family transport system permease protein n=1 Tax=Phyllobacterium trifolii TaxID=300193 RepID=A0A839UBV9_9HYPH|nr:ABC transporter permease [Phyllobacterium trifolii]MBB3148468.1 NitT/TauT family transport system permease protein [Phyllobacterium trifolii]
MALTRTPSDAPDTVIRRKSSWSSSAVPAQAALIFVLLLLWELASYYLYNPFWGSRPSMIAERLWELAVSGHLWMHTSTTLQEAGAGLLLAALLGVPAGIGLARAPRLARLLDPVIMGLYGLPRVALAPLFILWFGIGLFSKIMMSFTMVLFIFILNVMEGIRTIDQDQLDLMKSMRAGRLYVVWTVLLPAIVPWILASFRIGVGLALIGAVVGELIGSNRGLGWYVESSGGQLDTTGVFSGLVVLMILAMVANYLIGFIERKIIKWR